ncbi:MAG: hypothetical protein Q7R50_06300 [Dehalococcoidales bacterium]|nr:hypothetical protein [Dehalococcoidales bacterium]
MNIPRDATDVNNFLREMKRTVAGNDDGCYGWRFVTRQKSVDCVAELGFRLADVGATLLDLTIADYCEGPLRDTGMPGDLWVFGKILNEKEVYIKLKLAKLGPLQIVRVVSFHFSEEPLCYPYKQ